MGHAPFAALTLAGRLLALESPGARVRGVLVIDKVVPPGNVPSPARMGDIIVMVLLGGRERSGAELRSLFSSCGFHVDEGPRDGHDCRLD